ncbi:DUF4190 domain-containing protein [Streptomyces sp. NPDC003691]
MTMPPPPPGEQQPGAEQPPAPAVPPPWAQAPPQWHPPHPGTGGESRNAVGVTAMVLGIIGLVLCLAVILFWLSWLPSLAALVLGIIGLSFVRSGRANNRGMALAGVITGTVGLVIALITAAVTVLLVKESHDEDRAAERKAEASASAEARQDQQEREEAAATAAARELSFGEPFLFENGLKVTVHKPKKFTPDAFANGHAKGNKAIELVITVHNTTKARIPVETGLPEVTDATGTAVELLIDGSGRQKILLGRVPPGEQAVGRYAFSVPPAAAHEIEVSFSPDAGSWDDAYWTGPA